MRDAYRERQIGKSGFERLIDTQENGPSPIDEGNRFPIMAIRLIGGQKKPWNEIVCPCCRRISNIMSIGLPVGAPDARSIRADDVPNISDMRARCG